MTIQIPDAGTGNGATGDNEYILWQKTINNFSDQTNAASRLVGTGAEQVPLSKNIPSLLGTAATRNVGTESGQVPLVESVMKASYGLGATTASSGFNYDNAEVGVNYYVAGFANAVNAPVVGKEFLVFTQYSYLKTGKIQTATEYSTGIEWVRVFNTVWSAWRKVVLTNADGGISTTYTQAGIDAPKTAQKLLTATYTASNFLIPLGISTTRILSISVTVTAPSGEVIPYGYNIAGLKFYYFASGTNISMRTTGEDSLLVGGIVKVFISYEV